MTNSRKVPHSNASGDVVYYVCEVHKWDFEPEDYCPECKGEERATERIIKLLEKQAEITGYVEVKLETLIALIKGENK